MYCYIVSVHDTSDSFGLKLLEPLSMTTFAISLDCVELLMKQEKLKVYGLTINDTGKLVLPSWVNRLSTFNWRTGGLMRHFCDVYVIKKIVIDNVAYYKLLDFDGEIKDVDEAQLISLARKESVANAYYSGGLKLTNVRKTLYYKDSAFITRAFEMYNEFSAKCKLLGVDSEFNWEIVDGEVSIKHYYGHNRFIVPNFVSGIQRNATYCSGNMSLELGTSLKSIGARAFFGNEITNEIKLPRTVEFIGTDAFTFVNLDNFYTSFIKVRQLNGSIFYIRK